MSTQRFFYCASRVQTYLACTGEVVFLRNADGLMAELSRASSALLITDSNDSVLHSIGRTTSGTPTYTCYGYDTGDEQPTSWMGFNGEFRTLWASCYSLGNGYRLYCPALMRFSSPDSHSPFGKGGMNAYSYCECDPVNRTDPTGHMYRVRSRSASPVSSMVPRTTLRRASSGHLKNRYLVRGNGDSANPTPSPDNQSTASSSPFSSRETTPSPVPSQEHTFTLDTQSMHSVGATSSARSSFSNESRSTTSEVDWSSSGRSSPARPENLHENVQRLSLSSAGAQIRTDG